MRVTERLIVFISILSHSYNLFCKELDLGLSVTVCGVATLVFSFWYEGIRVIFYLQAFSAILYTASAPFLSDCLARTALESLCLMISTLTALLMYLFCEVDWKGLKLNGPYEVGFREFRTTQFDNEVSVFYPISKEEHRRHINDPGRNTEWLRNGDKTLLGIAKAAGGYAYGGKGKHISLASMRPLKFVHTNTLNYGTPAKDIVDKLVPVIFCHGLSSNRGMHSGTARDFASHGYIVFILDHRDESCSYVESRDGKNGMYYNNDH
jgi:hypothetical protein